MKKNNIFIVIEGLDGSGKTTIIKIISNKLSAKIYKTPTWPFLNIRELIDKNVNIESRFYFYLSSVIHASSEIKNEIKKNTIICDRYILSTLCYHRAKNIFLKNFDENELKILKSDFSFFLNAEYQVRMKRIALRENENYSKVVSRELHEKNYQDKVKNEYLNYNNLLWIDTNNILANEVANIILRKIF